MGKHKIIKSAAAVALGASVVTTAVAPGAASAATKYKVNSKGQLVLKSTGSLVKGWVEFSGKLYKNGKLAPAKKYKIVGTGSAQKLYYGPTLKKGYKTASSKTLLFKDGKLAKGSKQTADRTRYYENGKLATGWDVVAADETKYIYKSGKLYKDPKTATRDSVLNYFENGKLAEGTKAYEGKLFTDGVVDTKDQLVEGTLYINGQLPTEATKFGEGEDAKYYGTDGKLYTGKVTVDGKEVEVKDGVVVAASDLKIDSASANDNTTVTVKLAAPFEGEVKAADFKIDGLAVSEATIGTSKDTVILKTEAQEADKQYTVTYQDNAENKAVFVGKAAEGQSFEFSSATARTNTEVTVVLTDAPLKDLSKNDFQIAGLTVESVTVNNNVVTLKTSPQTAGTEYTVTSPIGTGSAKFTGLAAVDTSGVVSAVTLENARQIKVEFNRDITWASAQELANYYIGLTDEATGDLKTSSLSKYNAEWEVVAGTQETKDNASVKYVILQSKTGAKIDDAVTANGLGLKKNENVTIETRDLKDANGFTSNSKGTFVVADTAKPTVTSVTQIAAINGLWNDNKKDTNYLGYTIAADKAYVEVKFNEPVTEFDNKNFKVYIDGLAIDLTTDVKLVGNIKQNGTVTEASTMLIDVTALTKEEHDLKIVGANDLNGNVVSPNPYQTKFTVSNEIKTPPAAPVKPNVTGIKQIADNAVEITFDQPDVVAADNTKETVTIKGADFDSTGQTAQDVKIAAADIKSTPITNDDDKVVGTKWTVKLPAKLDGKETPGGGVDYLNQQQILRSIEVSNYKTSVAQDPYYYGDTYAAATVLQLDKLAPEVTTLTTGTYNASGKVIDAFAPVINVAFNDAPFEGTVVGVSGKVIKISRTDKDGKTTDETVDAGSLTQIGAGKALQIAVPTSLLTSEGKLFAESVYTVEFAEESVKDAPEDFITGDEALVNLEGYYNGIKKVAKSVTTPKVGTSTTAEGRVPQTSKGLIQSGKEIVAGPTAVTALGTAEKVGTKAWFALPENQNKVLVAFDGEVLESSALNKGNYKFNGTALPANAKVTFYSDKINDNAFNLVNGVKLTNFVIIELPEGSVQKDGQYDIEVFNITNKAGKVMLPVADAVQLTDNTKPTVKSVKVTGSKQVELTFDEAVTASDAASARANFVVTVNGQVLAVSEVKQGSAENKLDLVLSQDFTISGAKVNVQIKADANKRMFVKDKAGNELATSVVNN